LRVVFADENLTNFSGLSRAGYRPRLPYGLSLDSHYRDRLAAFAPELITGLNVRFLPIQDYAFNVLWTCTEPGTDGVSPAYSSSRRRGQHKRKHGS
jgi:hypothetical protein